MRIVSKFRDYYDSAQGYGADPKLAYIRETKELTLKEPYWSQRMGPDDRKLNAAMNWFRDKLPPSYTYYDRGVVGFCGKAYPFYRAVRYTDEPMTVTAKKTLYSFDAIIHYLETTPTFRPAEVREQIAQLKSTKYHRYSGNLNAAHWKVYQEKFNPVLPDDVFRQFNAPVVAFWENVGGTPMLVINPILREYDFASQVDPYRAFQELSMYVGNNLVTQKDPNPPIPDDLKAQSKGFDEWSFRRHKTESKKYKKKNK
jgi:hypothetical protein